MQGTSRRAVAGFLALLALAASPAPSPPAEAAPGAEAFSKRVVRATLDNGLRVLVFPKRGSPVAATMVWYDVGSREEKEGETGIAHFLEHMMFKGAGSFARGAIDRLTQRNGGHNNAFTGEDDTAYYYEFAADRWDAALPVMAAQMNALTLDKKEFELERGPVLDELHRTLDEPWNRLHMQIAEKMFEGHGYAHPVIGYEKEVEKLTTDAMRAYYQRHYGPNRAVFVAVGDLDAEKVIARVRELFGAIAKVEPGPGPVPGSRPAGKPGRVSFDDSNLAAPRILVGYPSGRIGDPEDYVLDVISQILTGGKTGRIVRRLVETDQVATETDSDNDVRRDAGAFWLAIECQPEADPEKVLKAALEEIERLRTEGPTEREMRRAKNNFRAHFVRNQETALGLAEVIGEFEILTGVSYLDDYLARVEKVSPEDVKRVTGEILDPAKASVGFALPKAEAKTEAPAGGGAGGGGAAPAKPPRPRLRFPSLEAAGSPLDRPLPVVARTLGNGIRLFILPRREVPLVSIETFVDAGSRFEAPEKAGVANLTGRLLREGTAARTAEQIADEIEFVGGELSTDATGVSVDVLSKDVGVGLDVFADVLRDPAFRPADFDRERKKVQAEIKREEEEPEVQVSRRFSKIVYGKHPYGRPSRGTAETVAALAPEDCRAHHARFFVPSNLRIAVVGDVDPDAITAEIEKRLGDWKGKPVEFPAVPEAGPAPASRVDIPSDRAQSYLVLGHLGIRRTDPDYHALLVLDNVLGTGAGFTDRLSKRIREEEGLAYSIYGVIASGAGAEPSAFRVAAGVDAKDLERVLQEIGFEIDRVLFEDPSADEVEGAKAALLGDLAFDLEGNADAASSILDWDYFGLGFDYPAKFRAAIQAVTPAEVRRVARKHLLPGSFVIVTTGPGVDAAEPGKEPPKEEPKEKAPAAPAKQPAPVP